MRLFVDHPEVDEVSKHAARLREGNNWKQPKFLRSALGAQLNQSSKRRLEKISVVCSGGCEIFPALTMLERRVLAFALLHGTRSTCFTQKSLRKDRRSHTVSSI
jgi:hypothetical protein